MDERLSKALEFANYRQTLNNQLHQLKVSAQANLMIAKNGGHFTIDRTLISFVNALINEDQETAVLLDDSFMPIMIDDLEDFQDEMLDRYFKVTNEYHASYEKIRKSRKIEMIIKNAGGDEDE